MPTPTLSRRIRFCTLALSFLAAVGISSCTTEKAPPRSTRVDRSNLMPEVPGILRGTIASRAAVVGYQPIVVRGYGLVVGLNGTGSSDIPPSLRAHMLAEMGRHGIGSERTGTAHINPTAMLNSPDTAVVVVEAVIPPGAIGRRYLPRKWGEAKQVIPGTKFDVRVYADPRTGTTSLEGGRLYTCELRPGLPQTGSRQASPLAEAGGPIFANPFTDPGTDSTAVNRTVGRILNGGEVLEDMPVKLRLFDPSHSGSSHLQNTINAKFPEEPLQGGPTAHGESDESIEITVPPSYRDNTEEFVQLLRHTTIRLSDPEGSAGLVRRSVLENPADAETASWRWRALGPRALPVIRDFYDHVEELPRLAALQAGAKLNDALVVPHLIDMARNASAQSRIPAVNLLGEMRVDPRIGGALRELLDDEDVGVRLAVYEALVKRGDPSIQRIAVGEKFIVDVLESDHPMIYIAQLGQPRIVIFSRDLSLNLPITVQIWSNRLMLKGDAGQEQVDVFYRQSPEDIRGVVLTADRNLAEFVRFLGHRTTIEQPAPGLGLSYGQTVGALYQIWSQNYIAADFKAEQDRILAAIVAQEARATVTERPEFSEPESESPDSARPGQPGSSPPSQPRDGYSPR
ncbi:MAG: flagellar basal body P-ring protein FlgI [Phycisphaerales bacterium]|nr:MAG: flagellar basal body P-ring protein FlgI [Phycisphaerales bacterium]